MARRAPARARPGPLDRPVHVPAREQPARELRRMAVRIALLAALGGLRTCRRLECAFAADLPRGRRLHVPLAPRARPAARRRSRRGAGVRARALPRRAERGPPPRDDRRLPAARALGVRALPAREPRVARSLGARHRLDPLLGPPPRARSRPFLPALRRVPRARPVDPGRRPGRGRVRRPGRGARQPADLGLDRQRRTLAGRGLGLLGRRARLRHPPPPPRPGELRLPRLADTATCARGPRRAGPRAAAGARAGAGRRRGRSAAARARNALPLLRDDLAPLPAASLPARTRTRDAGRVSRGSGTRRVRDGMGFPTGAAARSWWRRSPSRSSSTCASG